MQQVSQPIIKDLVLIGGGHSHAIVLKMFGMNPLPGVRLTLITETSHTPYSGMLPGMVAGFYNYDESHIDLRPLAQFAQAQLLIDKVIGLDLENNKVICANRPDVAFDLLSINIGSTPAILSVTGAAEYAIPAKPVPKFLDSWNQLLKSVAETPNKPIRIAIVGGGAGGVELALAMQSRLKPFFEVSQQPIDNLQIDLIHSSNELMPKYNRWVRRLVQQSLIEQGVNLHLNEIVSEVQPQNIKCNSGFTLDYDKLFWVTQASAPNWIESAVFATDSQGFIQVDDYLRSLSHPQVFAAGDIATIVNHPRPKAGVFAVRAGKPLFNNLRRQLLEKPLKSWRPQKEYLSLIGTGDGSAIASWGAFGWQSPLLWRLKDYIDRQFMAKFSNLPDMSDASDRIVKFNVGLLSLGINSTPESQAIIPTPAMHCAGCGSKVGSTILEKALQRLNKDQSLLTVTNDIVIGLNTPDDAAVVKVPDGCLMVHTIDYFRALINDPFIFGQITTNHCLSDIFAMGAKPQSVLAIATIPYGLEEKQEETLYQLLSGAMKILSQSQSPLVGGHTTEGTELVFGLSCNGLAYPHQLLKKSGMQPGQLLILTKALGTGTLFAADMRLKAKGRWIDGAVKSMLLSNQLAAKCLFEHQASACTDVTGFGLLGHLVEMIKASSVGVELKLEALPVLDGAIETLNLELFSSLYPQNLQASRHITNLSQASDRSIFPILFDPQTAGGLLASIPVERAAVCLASLKALGYQESRIIGRVIPAIEGAKTIEII
ncbi:selenide, water dikinase SelD [Microcoleus sp. FACHB-831]|uniref:selenide, water dikinase SelD n=1 Tax=Microcoleus sp. FACHB-831 TaxID=2692827 RepID=UPI001684820E|nr:selenide, water dikinase SelD [Microcoleus sp. FACHB-831]MBD1920041.1 selenide, water dikinase SelD [Microcoleus sp. FACHB-831]